MSSADGGIKVVKDNLNKVLANMISTKKKDMSEAVVQLTKKNPEKKDAIAGGTVAVVGDGAGIGVAVHNKNKKKDQSTQGQDTQQPVTQPATKTGWTGFLRT